MTILNYRKCLIWCLNARLMFIVAILLGSAHSASGKTLVQYDPTDAQLSSNSLAPSFVDPGIMAGTLSEVGFGVFSNTNVLPVGFIGTSPVIELNRYVTFTITSSDGAAIRFDKLLYDKRSYFNHGARNASIRSSLDSFASDIDVISVDPSGDQSLSFNLGSLAPIAGPVTFRIYFYNAAGADDWDDLASTASSRNGLRVSGTLVNARLSSIDAVENSNADQRRNRRQGQARKAFQGRVRVFGQAG